MSGVARSLLLLLALAQGLAHALEPAPGTVLVAARGTGGVFRHSIVYMIEHGASGSLGLIINRATKVTLAELVPRLAELDRSARPVAYGGPVGMDAIKYLVRSREPLDEAIEVADGVFASGSPPLLENLLRRDTPHDALRVFVGYAGWSPRQLEGELERGVWFVARIPVVDVFAAGPDLWPRLIGELDPPGIQTLRLRPMPAASRGPTGEAAGAPAGAPARSTRARPQAGVPAVRDARALPSAWPLPGPPASSIEVSELVNSG